MAKLILKLSFLLFVMSACVSLEPPELKSPCVSSDSEFVVNPCVRRPANFYVREI